MDIVVGPPEIPPVVTKYSDRVKKILAQRNNPNKEDEDEKGSDKTEKDKKNGKNNSADDEKDKKK